MTMEAKDAKDKFIIPEEATMYLQIIQILYMAFASSYRTGHYYQRKTWSRNWQPTSVFLPGEFCGQRNLEAYIEFHSVRYN